ncbi:SGNH/GDSL hydrolase family protein [Kitasatospora sp. NBC_01287]|uniref:SGNH/GDSL hydrolase family protein n=1 Tax=Kitasatospora sp. NBC_01287 TaxID=2903573 RepID=UPI0022504D92|nr:SGNH/GDSL hydrolase family protein [Kitasatospora sp. NBC_01287]MCX4748550.1 SGNH/GDSL hydrolase family protein [Kitasatospora sp. NBC_01287]
MKRIISTLVAAALCAGAVLAAGPTSSAASTRAGRPALRIMPLGDSITVGVGSLHDTGYRLPLWRLVSLRPDVAAEFVGSQRDGAFAQPWHEGHSGWMINDLRGRVDGWLQASRPDVVLLHIGINDLDRGADKAHAVDRLQLLLDRIFTDRPGVAVVLLGLIPTTGGLQPLVAGFNERAQLLQGVERRLGRRLTYIGPPALTSDEFADRLHPDDLGYTRIAQAFYTGLLGSIEQAAATDRPGDRPAGRP